MKLLIHLLLFCSFFQAVGQYTQYSSEDKRALRDYEEARQYLKRSQFREAMEPLHDAIKRDPNFIEVWLALGSTHARFGSDSMTLVYFNKAIEIDPDYHKSKYAYFTIGEIFLKQARYQEAYDYLMHYQRTLPGDPVKEKRAERMVADCLFSMKAMESPFDYNIQVLPDHANYFMLQYFPVLSVDEKSIYFTRRVGIDPYDDEDIYYANKMNDGSWSIPKSISHKINTENNEGAASLSADGRMLVFTSCDGRRGYGSCDIYVSYKEGDDWSVPKNIGDEINSASWDAQPSLSADGRTIFFVSNRPQGFGGKDIWYATKNRRGKWQPARNLGKIVNSGRDEISPFMHSNGETLYFSSNGHEGLGGLDLFMSELQDSVWSFPVNLGFPLNDSHDQVSLYISSQSESGVYTIEKKAGYRVESKLYSFDLPDTFHVSNRSAFLKGTVTDNETSEPIASTIKIYKLNDSNYFSELKSDKVNGNYTIVLTEGNRYGIYVTSPGYVFNDFDFSFEDISSFDKNLLDIRLQPIKVGAKTVMGNIFFDFDEFTLKKESMSELRVAYYFLRNNPKVKVEISGHSDSKGSRAYNLELSKKRAQTVYDFLLSKGINSSQLTYAGYGYQQPLNLGDSDMDHAKNRRIEFAVVQVMN